MAGNRVRIATEVTGARKATGDIRGIRDAFDRLQKQGVKGFGIGVGATVTAKAFDAVGAAVGFATDQIGASIKAASALGEQLSKSKVIFAESADEIEAFGDKAALALGLSKRAAIEAASNFGTFFTGAGQSAAAAEDMSERLVTLAADLASFNNLDPTAVLQKLQSGLSGEAEPLRQVGVFLTEAKVKAKGMELGLADAHGELSEGAKVLARYQIILDETGKAQGDFERTSTSLANQQRRNAAIIENAQARVGKNLEGLAQTAATGIAYILDGEFRHEIDLAAKRVALATKTSEELERIRTDESSIFSQALAQEAAAGLLAERGAAARAAAETDASKAITKVYDALEERRAATVATTTATDDLTDSTEWLTEGSDKLSDGQKRLAKRLAITEDAVERLPGLFDDLADALYGATIRTGDLEQEQQDLAELLKEEPARKSSDEWVIWAGKVAESRQRLFELQFQMAQSQGPRALLSWLETTRASLDLTDTATKTLIDSLIRAAREAAGLAAIPAYTGPRPPGAGPLEGAGGSVPPAGRAVSLHMTVNLTGPVTPGAARQFADEIGPAVATYLQRNGLIARRAGPLAS